MALPRKLPTILYQLLVEGGREKHTHYNIKGMYEFQAPPFLFYFSKNVKIFKNEFL